jgi:transposase
MSAVSACSAQKSSISCVSSMPPIKEPPFGSSAAVAAYAGLNPQQCQSGISLNRPVQISKIGNAVLRTALYMPALSAMRYNPAVIALVDRLKARGRLKGKQIVIAAMRKLLVLCFGVLKSTAQ